MGVGEFRVKVCVWVCVYKETDRLTDRDGEFACSHVLLLWTI